MPRESSFSAFDQNEYNSSVNDFFGALGRVKDPKELQKENNERQEYNERLLSSTGAIAAPLLDQGLHGASAEIFKAAKKLIGKGSQTVAQKMGITPERFAEYAQKYGLSDETLEDLAKGKINVSRLAKQGLKAAFEELGKKSNVPTNLLQEGGNILAGGKGSVDSALKSVHSGLAQALGDTELTDIGSLPLSKNSSKQSLDYKAARRAARKAAKAALAEADRLKAAAANSGTPEALEAAAKADEDFQKARNNYLAVARAGFSGLSETKGNAGRAARDIVGTAREGLADTLKVKYGDADRDLAAIARNANVNKGKLLDANVSARHAITKAPVKIEIADPFETFALPSDVKKKVSSTLSVRNDGLSSVDLPEEWTPGKRGSMNVANQKQALREARRAAKEAAAGDISGMKTLESESDRLSKRAQRTYGRVAPPTIEQTKVPQTKDYKIETLNPFEISVFDNPQAKALRDQYTKEAANKQASAQLAKQLSEYETTKGARTLSDPLEGARSASLSLLPDIEELKQRGTAVGLTSLEGRGALGTGPLQQTEKGFVNQQLKFLERGKGSFAPIETNVAAPENVEKTPILSQEKPDAPLTDEGASVGAGAVGAALAAATPGQTAEQRAASAGEVLSGAAAQEAASALGAGEAVAGAAGIIPGAIVAATEKGTVAQRASRAGRAIGEGAAPQATGALVKSALSTAAQREGGDVGSTASNIASKAGADVSQSAGKDTANVVEKALATAGETEAETGGPEDIIGDLLSIGLGVGTLVGGLEGIKKPQLPTYRRPINPSVTYGI